MSAGEHFRDSETLTNIGRSSKCNNGSSDLLLTTNLERVKEVIGVFTGKSMANVSPGDIESGYASKSDKVTIDRFLTLDAAEEEDLRGCNNRIDNVLADVEEFCVLVVITEDFIS